MSTVTWSQTFKFLAHYSNIAYNPNHNPYIHNLWP